jgi:hypothetical protein
MKLALVGLTAAALLFRLAVYASTRAALNRVSPRWLNEHAYNRQGDTL